MMNQKFEKWNKIFKVGLIALGALIISPIIFMVVQGIVGAVIAASIGLVVVNAAPVVSMKLANWKVGAITAEAAKNPIETLQNLLIEKRNAYDTFVTNVTEAVAARNNFAVKCREFSTKYPARAAEFENQLAAMTKLVEQKKAALEQARRAIEAGEDKLVEARAYWEMSQAAQEANKAAKMDTGDLYEKLKADTALDSVINSMSTAFAEIEVAASLEPASTLAIENNPGYTIIPATTINSKVKVTA
jgi:Tfp pilus assembly protein FimV